MILKRYGSTPYGTFGQLTVGSSVFYTVERPWQSNIPSVSCVPHGSYKLLWRPTTTPVPAEYDLHTWYLSGGTVGFDREFRRTNCALHIGNICQDVSGCVAVGRSLGFVRGQWAVQGSRAALSEIYTLLGPVDSELVVVGSLAG